MSRIIFIFLIFLLAACSERQSDSVKINSENKKLPCACDSINITGQKFPDSLCGWYRSKPRNEAFSEGYAIHFYPNMTYKTIWGGFETSGSDSGRITFSNNIIAFYSCLHLIQTDSTSDEIVPETGTRYLIQNKRLFDIDKMNSIDRKNFMLKSGLHWTPDISLDSDGDGYAEEVNSFGKVITAAQYRSHKFISGFRFFYNRNNVMIKVLKYDMDSDGKQIVDTIESSESISECDNRFNE